MWRQTWQIFAGVLLGLFGLAYVAWGATYNFYFNNTEQGDNGTATPSVSVSGDGSVVKKSGAAEPVQVKGDAATVPAPDTKAPVTGAVSTAEAPAPVENQESKFRVAIGLTGVSDYSAGHQYHMDGELEISASASYFFNRDFGLSVFGSKLPSVGDTGDGTSYDHWLAGIEAEFVPIHITIGRMDDLIDLGVIGGVAAEYSSAENYSQSTVEPGSWQIRPEGGIRLGLNVGKSWSIIAGIRANADFATGEAALAFKL